MYKHQPHNNLIEGKLREIPGVDASQLWTGMQAILDRQMPVTERKKRGGAFWFFKSRYTGLLGLLGISAVSALALAYGYSNYSSAKNDIIVSSGNVSSSTTQTENSSYVSNEARVNAQAVSDDLPPVSQNRSEETVSGAISSDAAAYKGNSTGQYINTPDAASEEKSDFNPAANSNDQAKKGSGKKLVKNTSPTLNATTGVKFEDSQPDAMPELNRNKRINFITASEKNSPALPSSVDSINHKEISELFCQLQSVSTGTSSIGRRENEKGPYAGIMAGLDLSSINFSGLKTGSTKGLIMGYAFSNRLSLESGLFWAQKRYSGDGQYFRPTGYTLPAGVTMLAVAGDVRLYEWPLNVRYTMIPGKHRLFLTTGLSSYFMKKESYEYEYEQNGQYGKNYATYTNESTNLFSVINFSIGYTHKLGSIGSLRIEPYWKLPLKDLGINNMPVMSAGINVGLTRKITW